MATSSPAEPLDRLLRARIGLALREPFLASALMRLPFREVDANWCTTMATDGYHVFFHAPWVNGLTTDEIDGVLAHEVLHVTLGHADRLGNREPERWNVAADHAINLMLTDLGFQLPPGGCLNFRYRGMAADRIYDLLASAPEWTNRKNDLARDGCGGAQLAPLRDLLTPDDGRCAALRDADAPDLEARRMLRRTLVGAMRSKLQGLAAGNFEAELSVATNRQIDWSLLLRRWLSDLVRNDWRTYPFSKRHLHRGLYMPSVGVQMPGHIVFAVDTSGSMSDGDLAKAFAEVNALRETFPCRLSLVQCDAVVQRVEEFDAGDSATLPERMAVLGRGGTRFTPVFDWITKREEDVVVVVYLTDGFGTFPSVPPHTSVLWLVTPNGATESRFPFGEVIRMNSS